jgi:hypothetical protein
MLGWLKRLRTRNEPPPAPAAPPPPNPSGFAEGTSPAAARATPPEANVPVVPSRADIPHDKIAARAYEIWVRKGKPHGQDFQNWTEAEAELRAEFAAAPDPGPLPRKSR